MAAITSPPALIGTKLHSTIPAPHLPSSFHTPSPSSAQACSMAPRAAARVAPSRSLSSAATCGGCAQNCVMTAMLRWLPAHWAGLAKRRWRRCCSIRGTAKQTGACRCTSCEAERPHRRHGLGASLQYRRHALPLDDAPNLLCVRHTQHGWMDGGQQLQDSGGWNGGVHPIADKARELPSGAAAVANQWMCPQTTWGDRPDTGCAGCPACPPQPPTPFWHTQRTAALDLGAVGL